MLQIVKYDHILSLSPGPGDEDKLQFNAFYQREVAAYTALRVDEPLKAFDLGDFDANFKENWGRVQNPGIMVQLKYEMQPLREALQAKARVTLSSLERSQPGYSFMLVGACPALPQCPSQSQTRSACVCYHGRDKYCTVLYQHPLAAGSSRLALHFH